MALLRTPELDTIKPFPTPSTLASPILSPLSDQNMAEQPQRVRGLPTPKTTPLGDALIDSFKDVQVADNTQAAKVSIDRLTNGLTHTADFVPSWPGTEQESAWTGRHSEVELLAAHSLAQIVNSHPDDTDLEKDRPATSQAAPPRILRGPERGPPQAEALLRVSEPRAPSSDASSPSHPTAQPTALNVRSTNRKATFGFNQSDRAKTLERYAIFRRANLPSRDDIAQAVKPGSNARASLAWINSNLRHQEGGQFIAELDNYNYTLKRHLQPMEDAAARIVARGNTPWNRWNVPRCELNRECKRWEAEQAELGRMPKPRARPHAQRSTKKPAPPPAGLVEITTSQSTKRRHAQAEDASVPDTVSIGSQDGSEYVDEPPTKKTKTAVAKSERSPNESYDVDDGSRVEGIKTAAGKRKRTGEEPGKHLNSVRPKKSKSSRKSNAESGGPRRGNGEAKAKNAKDKRLGDIKHWLCSKTKKFYPPKKPGDAVTPDHKGDWEALGFVRLPEWGSKINTAEIDFDEKLGPKGDYHGGDPQDLHRNEQELARVNNLTYDQYRCQKRRIFAARAVFDRISETEGHPPSWGRTQTQLVGSIDANKSSYLYSNFDRWGWFDAVRDQWDDRYLANLVADFQSYFRQPWTPPSEA